MIDQLEGASFTRLFNAFKEIVWVRRPSGRIEFVNEAFHSGLGVEWSELDADPAAYLCHIVAEDRDRVLMAGRAAEDGRVEVEFRVRLPGRPLRWLLARVFPLHDKEGRVVAVMGIGRDITAEVGSDPLRKKLIRVKAERDEARSNEDQFRSILDRITDGFFALDRQWRFRYVNRRFEELLGMAATDAIGRSVLELYPEFRGSVFHQQYERALRENETVEFEAFWAPLEVWYEAHAYPSAEGLSVFFRDVTAKRRLEMELVEATGRERQRVGAELHDSVGQKLTGASLLVKALEARLAAGEAVDPAELGTVGEVLRDLVAETRRISRGLFPVELEGESLPAALENLAADVESLFGVSCRTRVSSGITFSRETEVHLLRTAQEVITNGVKHGGAEVVVVELCCTQRGVELTIEHDGSPPVTTGREGVGLGLRSLEYRAEAMGAVLNTVGVTGGGTRTTCRIPL